MFDTLVAMGLTTLTSAFVGSYFAGYLKKKGENLATKEDLECLVEQVAAVTRATKEIEWKISDEFWNRQRMWEMKRDAIFGFLQEMGKAEDALILLGSAIELETAAGDNTKHLSSKMEATEKWSDANATLDAKSITAAIVCGDPLGAAIDETKRELRRAAQRFFKKEAFNYLDATREYRSARDRLITRAREELGAYSTISNDQMKRP